MVRLTRLLTTKTTARAMLALMLGMIGVVAVATIAPAAEPKRWQFGMQPPATSVSDRLSTFHDELLIITALIAAFVLGLLVYVILRSAGGIEGNSGYCPRTSHVGSAADADLAIDASAFDGTVPR